MLKATGERFVPKVEKNVFTVIEHYHRYNTVAPYMKGLNVLDAGSGSGYGSCLLSDYAKNVTGIDISEEAVEFSNQTYAQNRDNLKYLAASVGELPFEDHIFDAVVSFEVIEHISRDLQELFWREVKRVLKPGGFFIISSPNKKVYSEEIGFTNPYHISELTIDEFKDKISKHFSSSRYYYQTYEPFSVIFDDKQEKNKEFNIIDIQDSSFYHRAYAIAVCAEQESSLDRIDLNSVVLRYDKDYYDAKNASIYCYISNLYYSESDEFDEQHKQFKTLHIFDGIVDQEYSFEEPKYLKKIRWDPIELGFCKISNPLFEVTLENGDILRINVNQTVYNGEKTENDVFIFSSIDPGFIFDMDFKVKRLHFKAEMSVMDNREIYNSLIKPLEIKNMETVNMLAQMQEHLNHTRNEFEQTKKLMNAYREELTKVEAALANSRKELNALKLDCIQSDNAIKLLLKEVSQKDIQINYLQKKMPNRIWNSISKKLKRT